MCLGRGTGVLVRRDTHLPRRMYNTHSGARIWQLEAIWLGHPADGPCEYALAHYETSQVHWPH
jgi:hypothetical protein